LDFTSQAGDLGTVDLDDEQRVHARGQDFLLRCAGSGAGGIMLVSGQATPKETWEDLQVRLGSVARVCTYDRPGVGTNLDEPTSQTFMDMAADLDAVIRAARLPRPLVVAGHSLGGPVAAYWAATHPRDVGAVVLLDPASYQYVAESVRQELGATDPISPARVLAGLRQGSGDRSVNPERIQPRAWIGLNTLPSLGAVPLAVLRHGEAGVDLYPVAGDHVGLEKAWVTGQQAWASTSTSATLVEVPGASHSIHEDRPALAVSAILWALDMAAAGQR
jgi:pimeloyl-ACP methyl ester carboxylesterase